MKKCFKCGIEKELTEFYKHPQMGDGHLNKCKSCTKNDVKTDYSKKSQDNVWMEKERYRGREKYHRLNYKDAEWNRRKNDLFWITPEYKGLRRWAEKRIVLTDMDELHHWNYQRLKDFFVLTKKIHATIHKRMIVDEITGLYTTNDGILLDTKSKHLSFIVRILNERGYSKATIGIYDFQT